MTEQEKAKLEVKIANEEYGEPDFVGCFGIVVAAFVVFCAIIWGLAVLIKHCIS